MRLLNTTTFELKDFLSSIPPYAILSHTWGEDELVYETFHTWDKASQGTSSTKKIFGFCSLAHQDGYEWSWLDTICIDKKSSAELSEAINSMFRWYANAAICYAYLADVKIDCQALENLEQFEKARWHTRGWTLQELLAPSRVDFFDVDWDQIGTKNSLQHNIWNVSGIREQVLARSFEPGSYNDKFCAAEKLSWASKRKTSREEDIAYCLLGLFDISMPLLYGEGKQAFQRLQRQILAQTEDFSLFAWKGKTPWRPHMRHCLFAPSPAEFCEVSEGEKEGKREEKRDWKYELLESGHYSSQCHNLAGSKVPGLVLGEPVERINGINFNLAFHDERMAILCRFRQSKDSSVSDYLCLPICKHNKFYEKVGIPTRISLVGTSEIFYQSAESCSGHPTPSLSSLKSLIILSQESCCLCTTTRRRGPNSTQQSTKRQPSCFYESEWLS